MKCPIECPHTFLETDYKNVTMDTIIEFKKSVNYVLNKITSWENRNYEQASIFTNFIEITNAAYGVIDNPYKNVRKNIFTMKNSLKKISKKISEDWILDNMMFVGKKQKFNPNIIILESVYSRNLEKDTGKWIKIVENFDEALELYNKAVNEATLILKKAAHLPETTEKVNGYYYRCTASGDCEKIKYKDKKITIDRYGLNRWDWSVHPHTETINFSKNDSIYSYIWKQECPEMYLV